MLGLCLVPMMFIGGVHTLQLPWHHSESLAPGFVEVQSCKEGLGARVAASADWVQAGPQYGYTWALGDDWSLTVQGHGGLGYSNTHHPVSGVRQVTRWNGGLALVLSAGPVSVKVGWDHMSNGRGADPSNSGQELVSGAVGVELGALWEWVREGN